MSNWIDYDVDVLASSPTEINQIEKRFKQPSTGLVKWVAMQFGNPVGKVKKDVKDLVAFQATSNLGYFTCQRQ